jgi:hypothetical protein
LSAADNYQPQRESQQQAFDSTHWKNRGSWKRKVALPATKEKGKRGRESFKR